MEVVFFLCERSERTGGGPWSGREGSQKSRRSCPPSLHHSISSILPSSPQPLERNVHPLKLQLLPFSSLVQNLTSCALQELGGVGSINSVSLKMDIYVLFLI